MVLGTEMVMEYHDQFGQLIYFNFDIHMSISVYQIYIYISEFCTYSLTNNNKNECTRSRPYKSYT